jgi:hypothetical protein
LVDARNWLQNTHGGSCDFGHGAALLKLRFAVLCPNAQLTAAAVDCVTNVLSITEAELALLILHPEPCNVPGECSTSCMRQSLWGLFARRVCSLRVLRLVSATATFPTAKTIEYRAGHDANHDAVPDNLEAIRKFGLDFILNFNPALACDAVTEAAKYGVWAFHYGDKRRVGPLGFWEVFSGESVLRITLERTGPGKIRGTPLVQCIVKTVPHSYVETVETVARAATYLPARACRDLLTDSAVCIVADKMDDRVKQRHPPTRLQVLLFLFKLGMRWLRRQLESIFFLEDWNVGLVRRPISAFLDPTFIPQVQWLDYRRNESFLADPFLMEASSTLTLMAEEFDWRLNRGYIVQGELRNPVDMPLPLRPAIDEGIHMSYPFLLTHDGQHYCIPETYQDRRVSLYSFKHNESKWLRVATLIEDFSAVDSTLFEHAGRWWLWCTDFDNLPDTALYLWHSPDLFGPWEPHVANPVKMDVRSSRPAGQPFVVDGVLYRPAQDCSATYGGAITLNRVTLMTTREYMEESVVRIDPQLDGPYPCGVHTVAGFGQITALDGKRAIFAPRFAAHQLYRKLSRFFRG